MIKFSRNRNDVSTFSVHRGSLEQFLGVPNVHSLHAMKTVLSKNDLLLICKAHVACYTAEKLSFESLIYCAEKRMKRSCQCIKDRYFSKSVRVPVF